MANIAISELKTETTSLNDNDLLLVSKDNGGSFTSAKMKGSVLKGSTGTCNFSSDAVKTACQQAIDSKSLSTLTAAQVKSQCESAITSKGVSTLTSSQVQTACSSAMSSSSTSVNVKGVFIDPNKSDGFKTGNEDLTNYTLLYDSVIILVSPIGYVTSGYHPGTGTASLTIKVGSSGYNIVNLMSYSWGSSDDDRSGGSSSASESVYIKKGSVISISFSKYVSPSNPQIGGYYSICPLG